MLDLKDDKLYKSLINEMFKKTYCLNENLKKMINCSQFQYYIYRHILASLHFNENLHREKELSKDDRTYTKIVWQKLKMGEEAIKERAIPQTYGKNRTNENVLTVYTL